MQEPEHNRTFRSAEVDQSRALTGPEEGRIPGGRLTASGFAAQLRASWKTLWCVAVGLTRDAPRAEDVLQEAAMLAWAKVDRFEAGTNFTAWMTRFVHHVAQNERRRRARDKSHAVDPSALDWSPAGEHPGDPGPRRADIPEYQTLFDDAVIAALAELEEIPRACLLMRTLHDMPYREISQVLGIPEGTAMSHVHRARRALHTRLAAEPLHARRDNARKARRND